MWQQLLTLWGSIGTGNDLLPDDAKLSKIDVSWVGSCAIYP